ncbi:biotin--[acetyl-CoA-carboxylase] ligase [Maribellus sp. YY47]|uniref:biotin--[acetyl-CoA-carboxylase] ligase n=1 Tax=Maribellus sp. YY47 TaxID=2929486 RepID=UPI002000A017|nr:biotin--[acetyl-CoA-carboxylase] ligase [Maribellus sp. YY47]MCK3682577.1 biotin--[acetyl-CoA-carboxylase] ligase [Maribellus sp. YY47]
MDEVDSTNNYAKQLVSDGTENGTVVLAQFQSRGKGQPGNFWESVAEKNLLTSVILYPVFLEAARQFLISKIVSLSLLDLLNTEVENVSIKWPNDIYIGNRKVAGILIENSIKGSKLDWSIIGIGLNLNQLEFHSDAPNPVSLQQLNGKEYDIQETLKGWLYYFRKWYQLLEAGQVDEIETAYLNRLFGFNQWRNFRKDKVVFEARISGIGEFGQLQLEDRSGKITEYMFKEVEYIF